MKTKIKYSLNFNTNWENGRIYFIYIILYDVTQCKLAVPPDTLNSNIVYQLIYCCFNKTIISCKYKLQILSNGNENISKYSCADVIYIVLTWHIYVPNNVHPPKPLVNNDHANIRVWVAKKSGWQHDTLCTFRKHDAIGINDYA